MSHIRLIYLEEEAAVIRQGAFRDDALLDQLHVICLELGACAACVKVVEKRGEGPGQTLRGNWLIM